jgi:hypothetical protein
MMYSLVDRLCAARDNDPCAGTERDMKIERIITALAAMITQCASSAQSQTFRMAIADNACDA